MHFATITADNREMRSGVIQILRKQGLSVHVRTLDIGDYVIGEYAVERKTTHDFLSSLYSGRLFEQAQRLSGAYKTYLLVVEGDMHEVFDMKNPRVFWGTMLSLALRFGFRIFFTLNSDQTAELLRVLASRSSKGAIPMVVSKPKMGTIMDRQLNIVESLPAIGPKLGEQLLKAFGCIRSIFEASATELAVKGGIGLARAARISQVLDAEFSSDHVRQTKLTENVQT